MQQNDDLLMLVHCSGQGMWPWSLAALIVPLILPLAGAFQAARAWERRVDAGPACSRVATASGTAALLVERRRTSARAARLGAWRGGGPGRTHLTVAQALVEVPGGRGRSQARQRRVPGA
jgi:hypothetical protein